MNHNSFHCSDCNYSCNSKQNYEKHLTTQKHFKNANIFRCEECNYTCHTFQNYEKHLDTYKHINATSNKPTFICKKCKYICYNKQRFNRHLETQGHIKKNVVYVCETCNKTYKHKSSLDTHQNITGCANELRQTIIDISKNIQQPQTIIQHNNTMVNNTTNSNNNSNNTFNLQIFLNETCKDAINLTEFIENIKISLMDLETVGNRGYVKGISNIIIKNLSDLDETKRPVHCSDAKRETLYIKDNNEWEKDQNGNPKMINAVKTISTQNIRQIGKWREENPEFDNSHSNISDTYQNIIRESCNIEGLNSEEKIIKNVSKSILIDKNITS